ncbi:MULTISPECIES: hypothetical protein [Myxococcus]|uniref:hypothetical protein n=1 Tax=Myxococcus TaxID=32 RepID=UPI00157A692B|nr:MULTISPECIES: hypothetical protein [Myxococcus]NTX01781.1 hypothetical protein [Myxococcus sp. CA040A]
MGRRHQVFVAPGPENEALPTEPSPWHQGREVYLPLEHWHLLLNEARHLDAAEAARLQEWSGRGALEDDTFAPSTGELDNAVAFLKRLASHVRSAPALVPEPTEEFPEDFIPEEHARMLDSVTAVFSESLQRGQPFRAWVT